MKSKASLVAMLAIAAGTLLGAASGCELVASVDRGKIEGNTGGATGGNTTGGSTGGVTGGGGATGGTTGGGGTTTTPPMCQNAATDCSGDPGDCKVWTCDAEGMCAKADAPDGTASANQQDQDCKKNVCMAGVATSMPDNTDAEDDGTACTTDTCDAAGMPVHTPVAIHDPCSDNGGTVCDDAGHCVACDVDADCTVAPETHCDAPNHVCVKELCVDGVKGQNETDIDCGGPDCGKCADDFGCMDDTDCQSNHCGNNSKCATGTCQDGILNNMQLGETDVDCGGSTCSPCSHDLKCKLNADCKSGNCDASNKCVANCTDTEKDQDETDVDCGGDICGKCANTKACGDAGDCSSGFCNNSVCAACANDGQCAGPEYCLLGVCVPDLMPGAVCSAGTQCSTNNCVDGVCCGSATCGTCQACNVAGSEGVCTNVASGSQDDTCTAGMNKQCDGSGNCKLNNGQTCALGTDCFSANCVDLTCCNNACAGTCKACNVAGSLGTCTNVPAGQDDNFPANACVGTSSCDGSGSCKKDNGTSCSLDGECVSGHCLDSVCCGSATCNTCQTCNGGTPGTCTNIASGPDNNPANACVGNFSCLNGSCKKTNGQGCSLGTDCVSGFCVDNVCCNTSCTTTCNSCNVTGLVGTCSVTWAGDDPHNDCGGPNNCNGAGACGLGANGVPCSGNSGCTSNNCMNNICAP